MGRKSVDARYGILPGLAGIAVCHGAGGVIFASLGPSSSLSVSSSWTPVARLTRAEFLKIKEREFVMAERAMGATDWSIMWKVILPNSAPPLIVAATLGVGVAILFEAALSFLGLGDPNTYSWGYMIGASRDFIWDAWWAVTFPGLAIFITVLSISLIGDGLNDALNPKLRLA